MSRPIICNPHAVFREEADGAFLFNAENGHLVCLNEMGSEVWKRCDGHRSGEDVVREMSEEFQEIDIERIRNDVEAFFERLERAGFISAEP